jgi:hypothetical protein
LFIALDETREPTSRSVKSKNPIRLGFGSPFPYVNMTEQEQREYLAFGLVLALLGSTWITVAITISGMRDGHPIDLWSTVCFVATLVAAFASVAIVAGYRKFGYLSLMAAVICFFLTPVPYFALRYGF